MKVTAETITDLQCWATRGFGSEIGDVGMAQISDRLKLASAFNMYIVCYPKFAKAFQDHAVK